MTKSAGVMAISPTSPRGAARKAGCTLPTQHKPISSHKKRRLSGRAPPAIGVSGRTSRWAERHAVLRTPAPVLAHLHCGIPLEFRDRSGRQGFQEGEFPAMEGASVLIRQRICLSGKIVFHGLGQSAGIVSAKSPPDPSGYAAASSVSTLGRVAGVGRRTGPATLCPGAGERWWALLDSNQ